MQAVRVVSDRVNYTDKLIKTRYAYKTTRVENADNFVKIHPVDVECDIHTDRHVPRLGVMLVGWGGNNGSTLTAAILANRNNYRWRTRRGWQSANYFGSLTQCSTLQLSPGAHVAFNSVLPMVQPNDLVIDGWDISSANLFESMKRAEVLDVGLQEQLQSTMSRMKPRAAIFDPNFVAANQVARADNIILANREQQLHRIRQDIREFRTTSGVDKVIVLWTANTERCCEVVEGVNTTADNLLASISADDRQHVSPSTVYAVAAVLEGCAFINGSPQNTFVPGLIDLAEQRRVYIAGDDFKSGQTKLKSVLVDFLVNAGIKPVSIVSYNHLGNNDGLNLSAPQQFRSKEISKSNVVDDMVESNSILYKPGEKPDHCVVIKYVPYVADSKRAMDEYTSEIMCGGHSTIVVHNTCEDSLLAAPIILDLIILTELFQRIKIRLEGEEEFHGFHCILSLLSYLCKAPLVPSGAPVVNALFRQRAALENLMRACIGLGPVNDLCLEHRLPAGCWPGDAVVKNSTRQHPSGGVSWKQNGFAVHGNDQLVTEHPAPSNGHNGN